MKLSRPYLAGHHLLQKQNHPVQTEEHCEKRVSFLGSFFVALRCQQNLAFMPDWPSVIRIENFIWQNAGSGNCAKIGEKRNKKQFQNLISSDFCLKFVTKVPRNAGTKQ